MKLNNIIDKYYYYQDFKIENKDKNHVWRILNLHENYIFILNILDTYDDLNVNNCFCVCDVCKNISLRITKDQYSPQIYKYYTHEQLLTCNEYIIKNIIE